MNDDGLDSYCPNNADHRHRLFINKTYEIYEKVTMPLYFDERPNTGESVPYPLYTRKEVAILGCPCGYVQRSAVRGEA